jgi:hypothetical protein
MKCWFEALPHVEMASRGCIKGLLESAVRTKGDEMNTAARTKRAGAGPRAQGTWLSVATRDISRSEAVGEELNAFTERRHRERVKIEGGRAEEAVSAETTWREEARQGRRTTAPGRRCAGAWRPSTRDARQSGRQEDELEDREANQPKGEDAA